MQKLFTLLLFLALINSLQARPQCDWNRNHILDPGVDKAPKSPGIFDSTLLLKWTESRTNVSEENKAVHFRLSPNPTNGNILISMPPNVITYTLSIRDVYGNLVQPPVRVNGNAFCTGINGIAGIYFVTIQSLQGTITSRVVKQ